MCGGNPRFNPSFSKVLVPISFTKGWGVEPTPTPQPSYLKIHCPHEPEIFRVLETPLKVLEMLKFSVYLVTITTPQMISIWGENREISAENTNNSNCYKIKNLQDNVTV